ncbi:MAG: type VI secretion system tube protein Hcp [Verrucomicrobiota bacterium]
MFLDLGTAYAGESRDSTYPGTIDTLAWSWGMSNSTTHLSGAGGVGTNKFQDLVLTKYVDKSSPLLMLACARGTHITTGKLIVRKAGPVGPTKYIEITLTDVLVASISTGGSGGEDRLTETISLNFGRVQFDYFPVLDNGAIGPAVRFRWDIPANATY